MNKDQLEGRKKVFAGAVRQVAGKIVGSREMQAKGKVMNALGKSQAAFGDVRADIRAYLKAGS